MNLTVIGSVIILIGTGLTILDSHLKSNTEDKMKTSIQPYIQRRKYLIAKACADIRQSLYFASKYPKDHGMYPEESFPSDSELLEMLKQINYMNEVPARTIPEGGMFWPEFIHEKMEITMSAIDDIHNKSHLVPPDLVKDIIEIERLSLITESEHLLKAHQKTIERHNVWLSQGKRPQYKGTLESYHKSLSNYFKVIKSFESKYVEFSEIPNARKYAN